MSRCPPLSAGQRRRELAALDPERDHQRIVHLLACYEFPWDMTRSLELALFRTFCDPVVSSLLARTGEMVDRAQRRYDDTDLLIGELLASGYDSERGTRALRRINELHGRFRIPNEAFRYVLSTFVFEPIRWNERFGWRRMTDAERLALFWFWRAVGERMGIRDLHPDYAAFERFNIEHERDNFRFADSNHRVGAATMAMFRSWFPAPLRPLIDLGFRAAMDEVMLTAFGFERPPPATRWMATTALRARAAGLRMLPKRRRPVLRPEQPHRTYPAGYTIESLGPPAPSA